MGKKGKPRRTKGGAQRGGGILGGIARAAGGAMPTRGGAATTARSGVFRVYPDGSMVRVPSKKKRKRGYVMPKVVRDQLEAARRQTDAVTARILAGH